MFRFERVPYKALNSRQKENCNFQKIAARLAGYGFNCLRLSDDWQGADFIACHIDGKTFLKVQLKGRLFVDRKYQGKDIYIAFLHRDDCYVYPHDEFLEEAEKLGKLGGCKSWDERGMYNWPSPRAWARELLADYRI